MAVAVGDGLAVAVAVGVGDGVAVAVGDGLAVAVGEGPGGGGRDHGRRGGAATPARLLYEKETALDVEER